MDTFDLKPPIMHPTLQRSTSPRRRGRGDAGEVSSWLVLSAALALVASLLAPILQSTFTELASGIGTAAGGGGVALGGGSDGPGGAANLVDVGEFAETTIPVANDPAPLESPSEEADEAFTDIVDEVDNGDDLGLSEGELDETHDLLVALTPEELDYVLSRLSDEQLERIFHNAYSDSFRSNDWNDTERREFFENLHRADQLQRNRIAQSLADSHNLDEDDYLSILHALEIDVSEGARQNGEALDGLLQGQIDPAYLDGPIADGAIAAGRVIIVNDEDYERAWREHISGYSDDDVAKSTPVFENSRGFVDSEERLWVKDSASRLPGTPIHEAVHGYSDDALGERSEAFNEGVTEYFTRAVLATLDDPATAEDEAQLAIKNRGYKANYQFADALVGVVGEEAVAAAYFDGDLDALEDAYIANTNRTEEDFDAMLDLVKKRDEADWHAAAALLTEVTP